MTDLGALAGRVSKRFRGVEREQFQPSAIDDQGQIVGLARDPTGSFEVGFLWQHGKLTSLGTFSGQLHRALTINNHGQILVQTTPATDKRGDAYLWKHGTLTKLPNFGRPATFATALDNRGVIIGRSLVAIGHILPFVWQNGTLTALPTLTGQDTPPWTSAVAINDQGQIAGSSYVEANGHTELHVVLWTTRRKG
jgi:probable HAF family extracellular repeat protein